MNDMDPQPKPPPISFIRGLKKDERSKEKDLKRPASFSLVNMIETLWDVCAVISAVK